MIETGSVILLFAACTGYGAAFLHILSLSTGMDRATHLGVSFGVGMGILGWLIFFPGIAGWFNVTTVLVLVSGGVIAGFHPTIRLVISSDAPPEPWTWATWIMVAALVLVLSMDVLKALAPPTDADSLAYHFSLPKQFAAAGIIEFVPRAGTGAAPLLIHMTYGAAWLLGGEGALTLWAAVSGWMAAGILFVMARRYVARDWAFGTALLFLTTPAMLYGANTGQVEARLAMFVIIGALAAGDAILTGRPSSAILAGTMTGFYAGAKFMGLLFIAATGLTLMLSRNRIRFAVLFSLAAAIAGSQWYVWNWVHTGDPVFPVLFDFLGLPDSAIWSAGHNALYRVSYFGVENPVPRGFLTFLSFPLDAFINPHPAIEAGRTGFGPLLLMVAPFALGGLWATRHTLWHSRLALAGFIALLFYVFWFWSGTSQRVRHFLPLYPVVLLCALVGAEYWARKTGLLRILGSALVLTLAIQMGGKLLQSVAFVRYALTDQSRDAFLQQNVAGHAAAHWINAHATKRDKVLVTENEMVYLIDVPVYHAHRNAQAAIDLSPRAKDVRRFWQQLRAQKITQIVLSGHVTNAGDIRVPDSEDIPLPGFLYSLREAGCVSLEATFESQRTNSRTLTRLGVYDAQIDTGGIFRVRAPTCRLDADKR